MNQTTGTLLEHFLATYANNPACKASESTHAVRLAVPFPEAAEVESAQDGG